MMKKVIVTGVLCASIGQLLFLSKTFRHDKAEPEPPFEDTSAFAATREIEFSQRHVGPEKELKISDSNIVNRLVAAIRLQRKEPCQCAHLLQASFRAASGDISVSFCDHCFDIQKTRDSYEGVRMYRMPKDFYALFCDLAKVQTNGWVLPNP